MLKSKKISPYIKITLSFLIVISIGTFLLALPISTNDFKGLSFIDSLFMTVTSVCVTGLTTVPNVGETISVFGKIVMAILIEIGGLSFITITLFFMVSFKVKLGISESFLMREALNQDSLKDLEKLVLKIVGITISFQVVGAVINTFIIFFSNELEFTFIQAMGIGIFHSISAFNNAGLDIFGTTASMIPYEANIALNIVTMVLIVIGGIGFTVIIDVFEKRSWKKLSLHSKITLITTTVLIVGGALLIKASMWNQMTPLQAIFTSITARTAGFSTFDMSAISNGCYILLIFLMFVGASSGSTGGGVKTSTLFIIINYIYNFARGRSTRAFYRKISEKLVLKAFGLIGFAVAYLVLITFLIATIEPNTVELRAILFEVVSAFSTTGLSMGITPSLMIGSKLLLCLSMFIGRIGPITLMGTMNKHWTIEESEKVSYIEENIMIG